MTSRLLAVTFHAREPERLAQFWAELLAREALANGDGVLLPGNDTQVGLRFTLGTTEKHDLNRMHLHLTSDGSDQETVVARALELGAVHLDVGQLPEEPHIVLADPEGNELCVIPPGNGFLAGCGFLGEVACDGSREVGVFWSEALGLPLVWDENEETAIQSAQGGTKIAWGGPPLAPLEMPPRQWFELASDDAGTEAERLVALGARRVSEDGLVFADPDGNYFRLRPTVSA